MTDLHSQTSPHEKAGIYDDDRSSLPAKVRILLEPSLYHRGASVETIETHFSWVFLVGGSVYKLKKPLKKSFLDLSTIALRRQNCETEVILNQRLTYEVYFGVEALTVDPIGRFHLTPLPSPLSGGAIDFVVHQRRLDPSIGMGQLLKNRAIKSAQLEALVQHLVAFYARQTPIGWNGDSYLTRLRAELVDCAQAFMAIESDDIRAPFSVIHSLEHFLKATNDDFARESVLSRIVEGHGDLRPEHIFFEEVPQIIDCLEFSYDLRCRDALDEVANLAMECDILGHKDVGNYLIETFVTIERIRDEAHLWAFYAAFRALVRAKLVAWRIANGHGADLERWRSRLKVYWAVAEKYAGFL
jgi:uncharacterized protein